MRWLKYGQAGFYLESSNLLATWASLDELLSLHESQGSRGGGTGHKVLPRRKALELCAEF